MTLDPGETPGSPHNNNGTVGQSGQDLTQGFTRAAEIYHARAAYRVEMFLYSALPCAILALGLMIISQVQPVFAAIISFVNTLSGGF